MRNIGLALSLLVLFGAGCSSPSMQTNSPRESATPLSSTTNSVHFQEPGLSSTLTLPVREYHAVTSSEEGVQRFQFGQSNQEVNGLLTFFSKNTEGELSFDGCWRSLDITSSAAPEDLTLAAPYSSFFLDQAVYLANDKKTTIMAETCEGPDKTLVSNIYWAPGVFQYKLGMWGNPLWKKNDQVILRLSLPYSDREQALKEIHKIAESIQITSPSEQLQPKQKILEKSADPNHLFGFIRSIHTENGQTTIEFDEAQFITNKAPTSAEDRLKPGIADLAAIEDGACGATASDAQVGQCAPNGFYIRNNSTTTRTLTLDNKTKITILAQSETQGVHPQTIQLNTFEHAFVTPSNEYNPPYYALAEGPYQVTLKNDIVTELKSFYIP